MLTTDAGRVADEYVVRVQSLLLVVFLVLSTLELLHFSIGSLLVFKVLAFVVMLLIAKISSMVAASRLSEVLAAAAIGIILGVAGVAMHWQSFLEVQVWLFKPVIFIVLCVGALPFLMRIDFSNSLFQNGLAVVVFLLMLTVYCQLSGLLLSETLFDYQAYFGLPPTRSHHKIFDEVFYRLSGLADEPAVYATTMFFLLSMADPRKIHWFIIIAAEVSMAVCLSALGWVMLVILYYRAFLLLSIKRWVLGTIASVSASVLLLYSVYPPSAPTYTAARLLCVWSDPSAQARLMAFMPSSLRDYLEMDISLCKQSYPDEEEILLEAKTGHQRGSNYTFIMTGFGLIGFLAFGLWVSRLVVLSNTMVSAPLFLFSLVMSGTLTAPIFWISQIGCAQLLGRIRKVRSSTRATALASA